MKSLQASNQTGRHSAVSIVLHWATAFLVIAIYALALAPGVIKGSIALHATFGIILLGLVAIRAAWRVGEGRSGAPAEGPKPLRIVAKASHLLLYGLLLAVPVLGMMYVDAKGIPFTFFGTTLPALAFYNRELAQSIYAAKTWLSYGLLALIFVHAAAAIVYHHFLRRDRVLHSMLLSDEPVSHGEPESSSDLAPAAR